MRLLKLIFSKRIIVALLLLAFSIGATRAQTMNVSARLMQAVDEGKLVALQGNVHALARLEYDRGPVPDSQPLRRLLLVLQRSPEQEAALQALLDEQQDKSSPNFHAWLTPEQFGQHFGPADADIQTLTLWLTAKGFTDISVGAGRTVIEFSGNVANVRYAFHTQIHRYLVNGEEHIANASDPQIPEALSPVIAGIVSLHDFRKKPMHHLVSGLRPTAIQVPTAAGPQFTYTCEDPNSGANVPCHALGPYDFGTIYNFLPLWKAATPIDGTGQTIAIVARTNINVQDISAFRALFGLPTDTPQVILDGPDPGLVRDDETEADLDVEWSGAVAKGATIKIVVSESTETTDGVDLSALYIVDHNLASAMSESYGQCEFNMGAAGNQFYSNLWQQAAAQGITAFVSSGDNGSAGCDFELAQGLQPPQPAQYGLQVNGIGSTPYNVSVGGTDFDDYFTSASYWNSTNDPSTLESAKGYVPETTWNDTCTNALFTNPHFNVSTNIETNCNNPTLGQLAVALGASGGKSNCTAPTGSTVTSCAGGYAKPGWQLAPGVPSDGRRDLPDVSLFASNGLEFSFYVICEADISNTTGPCSVSNFIGVGGTSASSPAFAGLMALVDQKTGSRQGNANYVFYKLASNQSASSCNSSTGPAAACVFNDITAGTIAMPCVTGSPNCTTANTSDGIGMLSGYSAGAGFDLATGLGSVNANNLVNNWNSAARNPSTAALILNGGNPVNITHGTPVSVTVSVTPTSPQPSGNASLIATQGTASYGFDLLTLTDGTASGTTNMLPGGASYGIQAHYAGDANYAASDSGPVTVTVSPEPSQTNVHVVTVDPLTGQVLNANTTSVPFGSIAQLRADITNNSATSCFNAITGSIPYACPSGTVALSVDGAALGTGTFALNSQGSAEYQGLQLSVGSHSLAGNYSGDNNYTGSAATSSVAGVPAPTITGAGTKFPLTIGIPQGFSVSMQSSAPGNFPTPPGGTFAIFDGGNQLPATIRNLVGVEYPYPNASIVYVIIDGEVTTTVSGPPGPHVYTVNYSGDTNYAPSSSTPEIFYAVYPTQTALSSSAPTIPNGQPVTITAQVTPSQSAGSAPTGSVAFNIDGEGGPTVALNNGQAQLNIPASSAGSIYLGATYSGDNYYASSTGTFIQTIAQIGTTTSVTSSNPTTGQNANVTFTAHVSPAQMGYAPLSGSVQFTANGTIIGGGQIIVGNQSQITTSFATLGSYQILATYNGDQNYLASSSGTLTENVVSSPPDFSLTSSGVTSQTIRAGQTAVFSNAISVSPLNGFASQVNLSCSLYASATTCSVSPSSLASGTGTATLTVTTTARSFAVPSSRIRHINLRPLIALLCGILLLLSFLEFTVRARRHRLAEALPFMVLALFLILQALGCGGGGSGSPPPQVGTPAGTYSINVNGISGNTTHSTTLTLIVN